MTKPRLSIIVIAFRIPEQLERTLYSLSVRYQLNVTESDYEVIVVENASDRCVDESFVYTYGDNFRYYRRQETGQSPVSAINFAFEKCRGKLLGLIIDGAYLVTPRVLQYALMAYRAVDHPVVVVPGYHLGDDVHENNHLSGHDQTRENSLLRKIGWPENGYRLFDISTISYANKRGFLQPIMECNCVFAPLLSFARIGFCDQRFTLKGGGSINLHIYRSLGTLPESNIVVLPGEGAFHQFHGGVSTSHYEERRAEIDAHKVQLNSLWGDNFQAVRKEPILLGAVTHWAQNNLIRSSEFAQKRFTRLTSLGRSEWEDMENPTPSRPHLSIEEAEALLRNRE